MAFPRRLKNGLWTAFARFEDVRNWRGLAIVYRLEASYGGLQSILQDLVGLGLGGVNKNVQLPELCFGALLGLCGPWVIIRPWSDNSIPAASEFQKTPVAQMEVLVTLQSDPTKTIPKLILPL